MIRLQGKFVKRLAGYATTTAARLLMHTMDYKIVYYDPTVDPVHPAFRGPIVFGFWHEFVLAPFYLRPFSRLTMLVSQHTDAEVITQAGHFVGFNVVRGSSNRGGVRALKEMFAQGKKTNLVITPDGPRGPRRQLAQGAVYLASRLGLPLVLWGFGHDRPWRTPTWDKFAIPRPFSRCRIVVGPQVHLPPDLDREGLEHYRQEMEKMLNMLTSEAENWAHSGTHYAGEKRAYLQPSSRCRLDLHLQESPQEVQEDDDSPHASLKISA